mmetsp:Transcript_16179/g.39791  ORF Transcript_16179/g.39791 Transcript_16179/m.39791 type:complete len:245 (-) Transcript_16179:279-1013(-)
MGGCGGGNMRRSMNPNPWLPPPSQSSLSCTDDTASASTAPARRNMRPLVAAAPPQGDITSAPRSPCAAEKPRLRPSPYTRTAAARVSGSRARACVIARTSRECNASCSAKGLRAGSPSPGAGRQAAGVARLYERDPPVPASSSSEYSPPPGSGWRGRCFGACGDRNQDPWPKVCGIFPPMADALIAGAGDRGSRASPHPSTRGTKPGVLIAREPLCALAAAEVEAVFSEANRLASFVSSAAGGS